MNTDITQTAALGTAAVTATAFNNAAIAALGVPMTVVGMAMGGALASFAYGNSIPKRGRLFFLALANTFLGSIAVALLPAALGWAWMRPEFQPPLAGAVAFGLRWVVPAFADALPQWFAARAGGYVPPPNPPQNQPNGDAP